MISNPSIVCLNIFLTNAHFVQKEDLLVSQCLLYKFNTILDAKTAIFLLDVDCRWGKDKGPRGKEQTQGS